MPVLDEFSLSGRRALVTGASRGLGRAMAQALAEAGASVAVVSRNLDDCRRAADEIAGSSGSKTVALEADVSKTGDIERLVPEAADDGSLHSGGGSGAPGVPARSGGRVRLGPGDVPFRDGQKGDRSRPARVPRPRRTAIATSQSPPICV